MTVDPTPTPSNPTPNPSPDDRPPAGVPPNVPPVVGPEPTGWSTGIAPKYIGLFLWVVYFDQLGRRALPIAGIGPAVLGALVAGILCYRLLYHVPATWGFRTGRTLDELGAGTFGAAGAHVLTGVLVGLAEVVWFAVATGYATELTLEGLVACNLLGPESLQPIRWGSTGLILPGATFLATSLLWSYAAGMTGQFLIAIIAALMNIYPIFMAVLLASAMLAMLGGAAQFHPSGIDPGVPWPLQSNSWRAFALLIELVFGFFALPGAMSADWGAVTRTERDVQRGGWVAVAGASGIVATLALLTVAGFLGKEVAHVHLAGPEAASFHAAVLDGIGGIPSGVILLVFGLGSLAPTCYAASIFSRRFLDAAPGMKLKRLHWTLIGTTTAWFLIVAGIARPARLETIFVVMGAVFAPLVASMSADFHRQKGRWSGPRSGVNLPGLIAWLVGMAVGLIPVVAGSLGWNRGAMFHPAALFGFLAAYFTYLTLAALGLDSRPSGTGLHRESEVRIEI